MILWNSGFIGAEYGLPYAGPFTLLFWRYLALSFILFLYLTARHRMQWMGWSNTAPTFVVGILAHGVWLSCVLLSLQYGVPAGIVALVVALQPLATGALSGLVVGEPTPIYRWFGLIIGFIGVAIPVFSRIDFQDSASIFGYFIPFGSAIAMTVASLIQRRMELHNRAHRFPLDLTLFYQSLATMVFLFLPAWIFENFATQWDPKFILAMSWLIIVVSLGAYGLMWVLIARIDATRVASLFYLGPPVTMLMAWITFGDILHLVDVIGLVVISVGVLLTQLQLGRNGCQG